MENKIIFTITAPSGAGKDSVGGAVMKELGIPELISTTSREPRIGEVNGVDYYFIKKDELPKDAFAEFVVYDGNQYGLTKKEIYNKLSNNDAVYCIVEKDGLRQLRAMYPDNIVSIFIDLPGDSIGSKLNEMRKRMKKRKDPEEKIRGRILNAVETNELYNGKYCDYIIVNEKIDKTKKELKRIIKNKLNEAE